jgi:hypothetical protein
VKVQLFSPVLVHCRSLFSRNGSSPFFFSKQPTGDPYQQAQSLNLTLRAFSSSNKKFHQNCCSHVSLSLSPCEPEIHLKTTTAQISGQNSGQKDCADCCQNIFRLRKNTENTENEKSTNPLMINPLLHKQHPKSAKLPKHPTAEENDDNDDDEEAAKEGKKDKKKEK